MNEDEFRNVNVRRDNNTAICDATSRCRWTEQWVHYLATDIYMADIY